ncbi:alpha-1,2-fucosyltransferase [Sphingobacterium sp. UT-1RO-CII-1]|uniref:alpha-1,2-fucosyltransferase n=1 Tax=Sphingobacterium sp. UT-1RO-CII-1 TaxID=2995225 RepID=UPI00227C5740|nr:alpha-1,2-fucosyltransferase [Sphingobacterium sp. UT-1RO-CII-1]MCY4781552.1 alpha-1,2-fucosyltransferase [Sphingobacterium sp. UT-1RO-CII-1]
MIVCNIQGGLGNQMFQYAAAFADGRLLYIDLDFLNNHNDSTDTFTARKFELDLFPNIKYKKANSRIKKIFFSKKLKYKIYRSFKKTITIQQNENELMYLPTKGNVYLNGYFQSEKYFNHKRAELLRIFEFPELDTKNNKIKEKIINAENSISIHVRRGDYLKPEVLKYHGVLTNQYYQEALKTINKNLTNYTVFVFSDDPNYCKTILFKDEENVNIITGNEKDAWKDMCLMSHCQHHIIANSSFSWWAAWLSQAENGIKIAPKKWFNALNTDFNINDIVPSSWLKI